jgi:uncharacterized membrane protein HdeD (DUF308 family)
LPLLDPERDVDGFSFLLIRGLVGVVVAFVAFAWPGITVALLVAMFGVYAILDGASNLFLGLSRTAVHGRSWAHALQGIVGIAAGILTFIWPGITLLALLWFIAAWAIVTGVLEVVAAVRLRRVITGEWLLALSGLLSIVFGILVFAFPAAGAVGISWVFATYAGAAGIILIVLAIRLRSRQMTLT